MGHRASFTSPREYTYAAQACALVGITMAVCSIGSMRTPPAMWTLLSVGLALFVVAIVLYGLAQQPQTQFEGTWRPDPPKLLDVTSSTSAPPMPGPMPMPMPTEANPRVTVENADDDDNDDIENDDDDIENDNDYGCDNTSSSVLLSIPLASAEAEAVSVPMDVPDQEPEAPVETQPALTPVNAKAEGAGAPATGFWRSGAEYERSRVMVQSGLRVDTPQLILARRANDMVRAAKTLRPNAYES